MSKYLINLKDRIAKMINVDIEAYVVPPDHSIRGLKRSKLRKLYDRMNYPRTKDPWVSSFSEPSNEVFSRGLNLGRPAPTKLF